VPCPSVKPCHAKTRYVGPELLLALNTAADSASYTVTAGITVSVEEPFIVPIAPEIVAIRPAVLAVASPEAFMVAAVVFDEVHVTVVVRSFVLLSLYVPVAWNCTVLPTVTDEFVGVTAMDFRTAAVTVSEGAVEWTTDPLVPVIVIV
jgi:hypothetical protein